MLVPANTRATIYLPKISKSVSNTESGKKIRPTKSKLSDPGLLSITEDDSSIKCLVGTGSYRFREIPANP